MALLLENLGFISLFCGVFAWRIAKNLSLALAPIFIYVCLSSIRMLDTANAGQALVEFLVCTLPVLFISNAYLCKFFRIINMINVLILLILLPFGDRWGMLFNASMSGCFIAVMLPWIFGKNKLETGLSVLSVLVTARHQPYGILGSSVLMWLFLTRRWKSLLWILAIGGAIGAWYVIRSPFTPFGLFVELTQGRYETWRLSMNLWLEQANPFYGAGLGTFYVVGPQITGHLGARYIWMHSDWLQILFEMGILGVLFTVIAVGYSLFKARKNLPVLISLTAYCVCALGNMPLRYPIFGLFGAFMVKLAHSKAWQAWPLLPPRQLFAYAPLKNQSSFLKSWVNLKKQWPLLTL